MSSSDDLHIDEQATVTPTSSPTRVSARGGGRSDVWPIGATVDDRYRVVDIHGGPGITGMGVVYILDDGERRFAAKTFQYQYARELRLVERFMREARTWLLTGFHPHIVHAYFVDIVDATPLLFMEYVEQDRDGQRSLADRIRRHALPIETAIRLAIHCCDGMAHAVAAVPGLVHRDLKPENLLITPKGRLKITDFGLVRCNLLEDAPMAPLTRGATESTEITLAGTAMGTPAYMAPEQFVNANEVTERSDIYAFGCTFYEALAGQRVFSSFGVPPESHMLHMRQQHLDASPVPLRVRRADCPSCLNDAVMRCLRKDPGDRWSSFAELAETLRDVQRQTTGLVHPVPKEEELPPAHVAGQFRSLTLLEGYGRAVRHRSLRENHGMSPYAFHLALASYFRVDGEDEEEARQLEKALRSARDQGGHEAARRLAEHAQRHGDVDAAARVVKNFIDTHPEAADHLLEPRIAVLIEKGYFDSAESLIAAVPEGFRRFALNVQFLRAAERHAELAQLLIRFRDETVARIEAAIGSIQDGDTLGWDQSADQLILHEVLVLLGASCDFTRLDAADHAPWPRIDGYPDFAPDMAYLSQACGELAQIPDALPQTERERMFKCARLLGYPERLQRFLERDERWIWLH